MIGPEGIVARWRGSRWLGLLLASLCAILLLVGQANAGATSPTIVEADGLDRMIAHGVKVVDIRRADEWRDTGVIRGSLLLTAVDADGRLVEGFPEALMKAVGPDEPVVVICRSGNRSAAIAKMMSERGGFTNVVDAAGGMRAWIGGGHPVTPCPSCRKPR